MNTYSDVKINAGKAGTLIITAQLLTAAETYCLAEAFYQTVKSQVDPVIKQVLAEKQYKIASKWCDVEKYGERGAEREDRVILEADNVYLISDSDFAEYQGILFEHWKRLNLTHIIEDNPDRCPKSVTEWQKIQANSDFINSATYLSGMTWNTLTSSAKFQENIDKATKLLLQMVAPNLKSSKEILNEIING